MITPSEVHHPRTYADIDPEAIANYMMANGWRLIHEEDGKNVGIRWFRHKLAPRWSNRELATNKMMPFALSHLLGATEPGTIVGGGTVLRVGAKRYRDYPQKNADVLDDLELHENRWIGFIIEDIQKLAAR